MTCAYTARIGLSAEGKTRQFSSFPDYQNIYIFFYSFFQGV